MMRKPVVMATIQGRGREPYSITAYDDGTYDAQGIPDTARPGWIEQMGPVAARDAQGNVIYDDGMRIVTIGEDAASWVRGLVEQRRPWYKITITELEEGAAR